MFDRLSDAIAAFIGIVLLIGVCLGALLSYFLF